MKKVLTLMLVFALSLTFVGCTTKVNTEDVDNLADAKQKLSLVVADPLSVKANVELPAGGLHESTIVWASDNEAVIAIDGTVTRPAIGADDVVVKLTATITIGEESDTKEFSLKVVASVPSVTITVAVLETSAIAVGDVVELEGVVIGTIQGKGFHMYDGTGFTYVYQGTDSTVAIGDNVTVEGEKATYFNTIQLSYPIVTVNSNTMAVPAFDETTMTKIYNEYPSLTTIYHSMVSFNGFVTLEGEYDSVFLNWYGRDLSLQQIEVYYKSGDLDKVAAIAALEGQIIDVEAILMDYYVSQSSFYRISVNTSGTVTDLGLPTDLQKANLYVAFADLSIGKIDAVDYDLTLPATAAQTGVALTWTTSDAAIIALDGTVVQTVGMDKMVTLTVSATVGSETVTKDYVVTVLDSNKSIPMTVTEALAETDGTSVLVKGVVTGFDYADRPYIQDAEGAAIYVRAEGMVLESGDEIIVRGILSSYTDTNGDTDLRQLDGTTVLVDILSSNNAIVSDDTKTPTYIAENYLDHYSEVFTMTVKYLGTSDIGGYPYVSFEGFVSATEDDIPLTISTDYLPGFDELYAVNDTLELTFLVSDYNFNTVRLIPVIELDLSDADMLAIIQTMINVPATVTEDLTLPTEDTDYNATIVWTSANSAIGVDGVVTAPAIGEDDAVGDLTATITVGDETPVVLTFTVTVPALLEPASLAPLFFSEYGDGDGGSCKYVEVYNPTNAEVDLSNYSIVKGGNGTTFADSDSVEVLTGMLAAGAVVVVGNPACLDLTDQAQDATVSTPTFPLTGIMFMASTNVGYINGDDALGLFFGETLIDVFGTNGTDPGSSWPVGNGNLTDGTSADTLLTRVATVMAGEIDWAVGAMQWDVAANGRDYSMVGDHMMSADGAAMLFFSEYGDGDGGSCKYVEVYNPTNAAVDLSYYTVVKGGNGTLFADSSNIDALSGMLAAGEVLVIGNPGCLVLTDQAQDATVSSTTFPLTGIMFMASTNVGYINGDDALGLFFGETLIDVIGTNGTDPGSSWPVGNGNLTDGTTANTLLTRVATVTAGETDWAVGAMQWIVATDGRDYSTVGAHTSDAPA